MFNDLCRSLLHKLLPNSVGQSGNQTQSQIGLVDCLCDL